MSITVNPYAKNRLGAKKAANNDDLYEGFDSTAASADLIASTVSRVNPLADSTGGGGAGAGAPIGGFSAGMNINMAMGIPPPTGQRGGQLTSQMRPPTGSLSLEGSGGNVPRPMTAVKAAGYTSQTKNQNTLFDPFNQQNSTGPAPPLQQKSLDTPELQARDMEKTVNRLIEESAQANVAGDLGKALDKAKEAGKRERILCRHREKSGLNDQINFDLTYSVCFNLAHQYHANGMFTEALNTYAIVVKNKQYPAAGRLRVNMGNIYYQQKKYPAAIKMYRMAMDQIGQQSREMRFKIMRNIGNSFVRLGQFQDAIHSYEAIMDQCPDAHSGFNLVVCYYALGDKEKMKKGFHALLKVPEYKSEEGEEEEENERVLNRVGTDRISTEGLSTKKPLPLVEDELRKDRRERRKVTHRYLYLAAKLIAPVIEKDMPTGYDWVIDALRGAKGEQSPRNAAGPTVGFPAISMELEIAKGVAFLKRRSISDAIEVFKSFEKKDMGLIAQAATNLSFLYFLEADMKNAEKYADLAVKSDRYNAKALVNKANYLFVKQDYESAKELYLEAIGVEADCVEAIYNLGLTNKRLNNLNESLQAFKKLHRIIPKDTQVLYHIGNLFDLVGENSSAAHWFNTLHNMIPTDPKVLARLGTIYTKEDDETQAFSNFSDSYNVYPVNMEVISWLGVWYVKSEYYEEAIQFFERAADIEPHELKWQLMVASCYRRMNATQQALQLYRHIHRQDPENVECIRYLCSLYKETNDPLYEEYARLLKKVERNVNGNNNKDNGGGGRYVKGEMKEDSSLNERGLQQHGADTPASSPNSNGRTINQNFKRSSDDFDPSAAIPQNGPKQTINQGGQQQGQDEWGDEGLPDDLLPL